MTDQSVPAGIQLQLVEQEMQMYRNSLYLNEIRHRVAKRLGDKERVEACIIEMEKLTQALDELQLIMDDLKQTKNPGPDWFDTQK
jgi:hypothetical protein